MKSVIGNREIVKKYPFIYGSAGVHPEDADKLTDADMDIIRAVSYTHLDVYKRQSLYLPTWLNWQSS